MVVNREDRFQCRVPPGIHVLHATHKALWLSGRLLQEARPTLSRDGLIRNRRFPIELGALLVNNSRRSGRAAHSIVSGKVSLLTGSHRLLGNPCA